MAPRLGALLTAPSSRPWTHTMPQAQAPRGRSRASSSSRVSPGPKSQARVPQMPPSHPLRGLVLEHAQSCAPQAWVRPRCAFLSIHHHLELSQWHWPHRAGSSLNLALPAPLHPPCHSSSGYCATHSPHVTQPTKKTCKQPDAASSPLHAFKTTWCPTRIS